MVLLTCISIYVILTHQINECLRTEAVQIHLAVYSQHKPTWHCLKSTQHFESNNRAFQELSVTYSLSFILLEPVFPRTYLHFMNGANCENQIRKNLGDK